MPNAKTGWWIMVLLGVSTAAGATTVQRCVGSDGQLTFTHTSCPDGTPGQRERVWNPPPGSVAPTARKAVSQAHTARPARTSDAHASAARNTAAAPKQHLPSKEKAETETKGKKKKKKKTKYTPWRPERG